MVINKIILKEHKTERSQHSVPRIFQLWCQLSFKESSTTSDLSQLLPWVATPSSPHYVFMIQQCVCQSSELKQCRGRNKLGHMLNPAFYTQPLLSFQGILYSQTRVVDVFAVLLPPRLDYVNFSLKDYLNSRAAVVSHIYVEIF